METTPDSNASLGEASIGDSDDRVGSSETLRMQLLAIRDEWLAPLVAQIAEQAATIGRLEERLEQERRRSDELEAWKTSKIIEKDELIARLHRRIADLAEELDAVESAARHDDVDTLRARVSALEDATAVHSRARRSGMRFRKP